MTTSQLPPMVAIVGPTAVGKTELSLRVAQELDGEIINADSMQFYRGMDIGTAKLPVDQRRDIPHHLIDIWDIDEAASVAVFADLARTAIDHVASRGKLPILIGGSGLYVTAVTDGITFPGTDDAIRAHWEEQLEQQGPHALHAVLAQQDPQAAAAILPGNGRRIVRALEVIELTGEPFVARLPDSNPSPQVVMIGLDADRDVVDDRIEQRVNHMWQDGLVDEVRQLAAHGLAEAPTASRAIGYRQLLDAWSQGRTENSAKEAIVVATRRFSRKQRAWYRQRAEVRWHDGGDLTDGGERMLNYALADAASLLQ